MEEINAASLSDKEEEPTATSNPVHLLGNEKSLMDMEEFETLDMSSSNISAFGKDPSPNDSYDDLMSNLQSSGLVSTTRPLVTSGEEEALFQIKGDSSFLPPSASPDYANVGKDSSLLLIGDENRVEDLIGGTISQQQRSGDNLLIGVDSRQPFDDSEILKSATSASDSSSDLLDKVLETESLESLPKAKDPKIGTKPITESQSYKSGSRAYETIAHPAPVKSEVAMEAETVGGNSNRNCEADCPFSPGAWFNPEKLHPVVAEYVYWRDPKKSGVAYGASLILLLSLKYFSFISVAAYLTLALLSVTVSFRIYKNVLQAVQKSNDGHPFKEYLDMDIALSQDKVGQTVETLIQHVNCVTTKLRSLVLVEDLCDTLKLALLAWCMTYVGAWFNGLTLVILALVAAFTLPKVYESNKAQIDVYAEILRTKGKEMIEMVNAKMPLGKKKKDQ